MLSEDIIQKLKAKGLNVRCNEKQYAIIKPIHIKGNGIPGDREKPIVELKVLNGELVDAEEQIETDAPLLIVSTDSNNRYVSVWQWVPGPGPGDFEVKFEKEVEAYEMVINYFFGDNAYFNAYRKYRMENVR